MALLGCGFDPGVTGVFCAHALKHHFDEIHTIDIIDCNAGDHGHPFATNFNPEINIREVTSDSKHWENKEWRIGPALTHKVSFKFPEIGYKNMYLMYHEELESLTKHFPEIQRARFWMTFGDSYLNHLEVLGNGSEWSRKGMGKEMGVVGPHEGIPQTAEPERLCDGNTRRRR